MAAADSSGMRCRESWVSSRMNGEINPTFNKADKRCSRVEPIDQVCTQAENAVQMEEDGVDSIKKTSFSVPVVASYMIISGEGDNSQEDEREVQTSESLHGHTRTQQGPGDSNFISGSQLECTVPIMSQGSYSSDVDPQTMAPEYKHEPLPQNSVVEHNSSRNEKSFQCKVCERHFETAARLKSHRAANACHAPYACRLCSREFHRANELAEHAEAAHADPRMCVLCGRLLSRKDKLENHVRTHTGEQPFECKFCLKRFSRRDRFNEHEKLHRGVSFKCGECQKCFSRRDKMKEHFQRSHHERTDECDWYGGSLR